MTKKSTHGLITAERGTPGEMIRISNKAGWVVTPVSMSEPPKTTDEFIATKYGKGRQVLLTADKKAYTHNVQGGFIGYIAYGEKPPKVDYEKFLLKFEKIMITNKRKDVEGYILLIDAKTGAYEKKPILIKRKE